MPRIVDHDARRREIATALWRVVREQGVDEISVRSVAAAAGWSAGALRHYFASQDDLLGFALQLMLEQSVERVRALMADEALTPLERAVALVESLLPMDEQRRGECLVWVAFADRARLDRTLGHIRQGGWDGTRYLARVVAADLAGTARPADLTAALDDAALEARARRLHVLVDGWTVHGISYPDLATPAALHADVEAELRSWT